MQGLFPCRVKHVFTSYQYVRNIVEFNGVEIVFTPSHSIDADTVTIIFGDEMHRIHRAYLVVELRLTRLPEDVLENSVRRVRVHHQFYDYK